MHTPEATCRRAKERRFSVPGESRVWLYDIVLRENDWESKERDVCEEKKRYNRNERAEGNQELATSRTESLRDKIEKREGILDVELRERPLHTHVCFGERYQLLGQLKPPVMPSEFGPNSLNSKQQYTVTLIRPPNLLLYSCYPLIPPVPTPFNFPANHGLDCKTHLPVPRGRCGLILHVRCPCRMSSCCEPPHWANIPIFPNRWSSCKRLPLLVISAITETIPSLRKEQSSPQLDP